MQDFTDLYLELSDKSETLERVNWIDIWREQVNFLEDEFPFPSPALFFNFLIQSTKDIGENMQEVTWQIDMYYFYETMSDTSRGSANRETAVDFLRGINDIYTKFHGSNGENYSGMRRTGFGPEPTGNSGYMYKTTFTCLSIDESAKKVYTDSTIDDIMIVNEAGPEPEPDENPLYTID